MTPQHRRERWDAARQGAVEDVLKEIRSEATIADKLEALRAFERATLIKGDAR